MIEKEELISDLKRYLESRNLYEDFIEEFGYNEDEINEIIEDYG